MNNLPVQMHPRYAEFVESIRDITLRKTPANMEFGFHVWLNAKSESLVETIDLANFSGDCSVQIQALKRDLNIKHREVAERERQCMMLAEDNERLQDELKHIKNTIAVFLNGGAVGERGKACMAIDGGNL